MRRFTPPAAALAALLAGAGVTHFAFPAFYDAMIPEPLPGTPRTWTISSGVVELAVAAAVLSPSTRRHGALAAATLFAGVLPANVKMAIDARSSDSSAYRLGTVALPVMCLSTDDDALVPAAASEALAGLIPGATRASMAWGGHAVNITRPQEFVMRVKDWVR